MFETEVERGANLLDTRRPGWADRIDEGTLNLQSVSSCTLGQEFGTFGFGKVKLGLNSADLIRHGFLLEAGQDGDLAYPQLTATWLEAIRARRWVMPVLEHIQPQDATQTERELVFA